MTKNTNFFKKLSKKVLTKGKRCGNITGSQTKERVKYEKNEKKFKKVLDKAE